MVVLVISSSLWVWVLYDCSALSAERWALMASTKVIREAGGHHLPFKCHHPTTPWHTIGLPQFHNTPLHGLSQPETKDEAWFYRCGSIRVVIPASRRFYCYPSSIGSSPEQSRRHAPSFTTVTEKQLIATYIISQKNRRKTERFKRAIQ